MAFFSNSHFIFLDNSEIFSLNPYPGIVKKKKKGFLNAFISSEPFTFMFSWHLLRFALSWFEGGVSFQPTDTALGLRACSVQMRWWAWWVDSPLCFLIFMFLFKCVTQTCNISTMTHVPMTFKGQSLSLQVVCALCLNKWSYSIYPASSTSLHKS